MEFERSLISADAVFSLWAVLLILAAMGFAVERTRIGRTVSGAVTVIVAAAVLSNLQVIPVSSPVYRTVWAYAVPVAIALLLFNADLQKIFREAGPTLLAFALGAVGAVAGVALGVAVFDFGAAEPALAGVFSATYIGGSVNFAAVAEAIGFKDGTMLSASVAADNVAAVIFLTMLVALPSAPMLRRFFPARGAAAQPTPPPDQPGAAVADGAFEPDAVAGALGLGFVIVAISGALASALGVPELRLLFVTGFAVSLASLAPKLMGRLKAAFPLGILLMYLFFAMIGAGVDLAAMAANGVALFFFALMIVSVHLLMLLALGRLLRLSLPEIVIGSNACILGAPTAAAMAGALGWRALVTPAVLCGTLGYVVANVVGLTFFRFLS